MPRLFLTTPINPQDHLLTFNTPVPHETEGTDSAVNQIRSKDKFGKWSRFQEFFRKMTFRHKNWIPLNATYLQIDEKFITELDHRVFVKVSKLAQATGFRQRDIRKAAKAHHLESSLNAHLEEGQRAANSGFSNKELHLSGLTGEIYQNILGAIEDPQKMLSKSTKKVTPNKKHKVYYNFSKNTWSERKKDYKKAERITVQYGEDGTAIQIKSDFVGARGVSKKAYFRPQLNTKELLVSCKEKTDTNHIANDLERRLYEELKDVPEIVNCHKSKEKDRHNKRHLNYLMDYYSGTFSTENPILSEQERFSVCRDYLRGMSALHEHGYLHFDLHGNNLYISKKDGKISGKLADFGNCRKISDVNDPSYFIDNMINSRAWTPNFGAFSPEMMAHWMRSKADQKKQVPSKRALEKHGMDISSTTISEKSDIFHFGVTLALQHYGLERLIDSKTSPSFLRFLNTFRIHENRMKDVSNNELLTLFKAYTKDHKAPKDTRSFDYLIWWMVRPNPDDRPTTVEAIEFLDDLINNPPEQHKKSCCF